jgi:hypothetical protein
LTAPPSLAQVQAEASSRELLVRPTERETRRRDYEWAATVERQQRLQALAPGCGTAWQYSRGCKLPVIPLDPVSLVPVAEAISDPRRFSTTGVSPRTWPMPWASAWVSTVAGRWRWLA